MIGVMVVYIRDVLFMVDLGAWQVWQHLEYMRMLAEYEDPEPPDDGGTKIRITALLAPFFL